MYQQGPAAPADSQPSGVKKLREGTDGDEAGASVRKSSPGTGKLSSCGLLPSGVWGQGPQCV